MEDGGDGSSATFGSDFAGYSRPDTNEAAEKTLAHEDENAVRAAYRGSDMLEQRRPLMEAWGVFCEGQARSRERIALGNRS